MTEEWRFMPYRTLSLIPLVLSLALLLAACGPSSTAEGETSAPDVAADVDAAALAAAEGWLALVDADDHEASWQATGPLFQEEVSAGEWRDSMTQVREDMGAVTERRLHDQTLETVMPGVPEGVYLMLEYRSVFERQPQGAELVVLARQEDGSWAVIGYFLQ
jgi:hypothetical protein